MDIIEYKKALRKAAADKEREQREKVDQEEARIREELRKQEQQKQLEEVNRLNSIACVSGWVDRG